MEKLNPDQVALWLQEGGEDGASDVEFAETMVRLWKLQNNGNSELSKEDMQEFDTTKFCNWLESCLDDIIFSEETDSSAWWKQEEN